MDPSPPAVARTRHREPRSNPARRHRPAAHPRDLAHAHSQPAVRSPRIRTGAWPGQALLPDDLRPLVPWMSIRCLNRAPVASVRVVIDDLVDLVLGLELATRAQSPRLATGLAPGALPTQPLLRLRARLRPPLLPRLWRVATTWRPRPPSRRQLRRSRRDRRRRHGRRPPRGHGPVDRLRRRGAHRRAVRGRATCGSRARWFARLCSRTRPRARPRRSRARRPGRRRSCPASWPSRRGPRSRRCRRRG